MKTHLVDLDDALLALVLSFAGARDVEAMATASRFVALHVLPQFPAIWRTLFAQQWKTLNFPLVGVADGTTRLELDARLRALFPSECTEGRMLQLLSRAIIPLPSGVDLDATRQFRGYSDANHRITPLEQHELDGNYSGDTSAAVHFAFDGQRFGNDRSVRGNVPFPTSFYIAVFKRQVGEVASKTKEFVYQIGATTSGYFEIDISSPANPPSSYTTRNGRVEMTAIGLVTSTFPLVGKQPGWVKPSFGYHGDNGKLYSAFPWRPLGPRFGVNDTVGCGVRRRKRGTGWRIFFSNNGRIVTSEHLPGSGRYVPCDSDHEWFPAVGLDSPDAVHINFGQQPFACDYVIDELFGECTGKGAILARQMLRNASKGRSRSASSVRRTCIDSFVSNILKRRRVPSS